MRKLQKDTAHAFRVLKTIIHRIDSDFNAFHNRHDAPPFVTIIVLLSWQKGKIHVLSLRYFVRCQHYWCWLSRRIRKSTLLVLTLQAHSVNLHCNHWPLSQWKFIKINEFYTELLVSENQHYRFVMLILWFLWYCEIKQENLQCCFPGRLHSAKNQQCKIPRKLDFVKILQCWILEIRASVNVRLIYHLKKMTRLDGGSSCASD